MFYCKTTNSPVDEANNFIKYKSDTCKLLSISKMRHL